MGLDRSPRTFARGGPDRALRPWRVCPAGKQRRRRDHMRAWSGGTHGLSGSGLSSRSVRPRRSRACSTSRSRPSRRAGGGSRGVRCASPAEPRTCRGRRSRPESRRCRPPPQRRRAGSCRVRPARRRGPGAPRQHAQSQVSDAALHSALAGEHRRDLDVQTRTRRPAGPAPRIITSQTGVIWPAGREFAPRLRAAVRGPNR